MLQRKLAISFCTHLHSKLLLNMSTFLKAWPSINSIYCILWWCDVAILCLLFRNPTGACCAACILCFIALLLVHSLLPYRVWQWTRAAWQKVIMRKNCIAAHAIICVRGHTETQGLLKWAWQAQRILILPAMILSTHTCIIKGHLIKDTLWKWRTLVQIGSAVPRGAFGSKAIELRAQH